MARPTIPADTPALVALTEATGVFKPAEIQALKEVLADYHAANHEFGHRCYTEEHDGRPVGFVYHAPAAMTDRAWHLWWIVVERGSQNHGIGSKLLTLAEYDIRQQGGRLLLIETSSLPHYAPTRRFYLKHGYTEGAVLRDFYADGDDQVIFRKRLLGSDPG